VALKAATHGLKGASSTIGARRLGVLAAQLEDHAGRRPAVAVDPGDVSGLADELDRVRAECLRITNVAPSPSAIESGDDSPDSGTARV
jgi:HPt (histidine-containing phosphotransfer) domain-containing protein